MIIERASAKGTRTIGGIFRNRMIIRGNAGSIARIMTSVLLLIRISYTKSKQHHPKGPPNQYLGLEPRNLSIRSPLFRS